MSSIDLRALEIALGTDAIAVNVTSNEFSVQDGPWRSINDLPSDQLDRYTTQATKVSSVDVNAERDRRVLLGTTFTPVGYSGDIAVAGDPLTKSNLQNLAFAASLRVAAGDLQSITRYRDENNVVHDLTPPQVLNLWSQGAEYVEAIFHKSWALKTNPDNIPTDFAEDRHWP